MTISNWDEVREYYDKKQKSKTSVMIGRVVKRLMKYNKNFVMCFVGDPGEGKSWACLDFCLTVDPTFFIINKLDAWDRLQFGEQADKFIAVMNKTNFLNNGNADMWDEIGRGLPKKEWYEVINRSINKFIQSFRWRRLLMASTVPDRSYVDKDTVSLFNMVVEMDKIDFKRGLSVGKIKEVQVNRLTGKTYYKYPRVKDKYGRIIEVRKMYFQKPPDFIIDIYEKKKRNWLKVADKNLQMVVESKQKKIIRDAIDPGTMINEIISGGNYKKFLRNGRLGPMIEPGEIMRVYGVGSKTARDIKSGVEFNLKRRGLI